MRKLAAVLAVLALAGCTSTTDDTVPASKASVSGGPSASVAPSATFSETTGAISGLVRGEDELPIAGARVGKNATEVAQTAADGRFTLSELLPGLYTIQVEKLGFDTVVKPVTVLAGAITPVNFTLIAFDPVLPYNETIILNGHITVGQAFVDIITGQMGLPGCDECDFHFNTTRDLHSIALELAMNPTLGNPAGPTILGYQLHKPPIDLGSSWGAGNIADGDKVIITPPAGANATANALQLVVYCDVAWACVDQDFSFYVSFFYLGPPDPTFTALPPG